MNRSKQTFDFAFALANAGKTECVRAFRVRASKRKILTS